MFQKFSKLTGDAMATLNKSVYSLSDELSPKEGDDDNETAARSSRTTSFISEETRASLFSNTESAKQGTLGAATSMFSMMKKGATTLKDSNLASRAIELKNKAVAATDLDKLQQRLGKSFDLATASDYELASLNFTYVTPNLIAMGFPGSGSPNKSGVMRYNPIDAVAYHLDTLHGGKFMIWNLSEEYYDYSKFEDQVLEFKFPGHPAPPLGLLFRICSSMESWLEADPEHVAVIHCLTGKGRTGSVLGCFLAWMGHFSPTEGLAFVARQRQTTVTKMTIPSQMRYVTYFANILEGIKPRASPLVLKRVILNTIPHFASREVTSTLKDEDPEAEASMMEQGCSPYLQLFKGGKLVFSTTWATDSQSGAPPVQWVGDTDGHLSFTVDALLQGDLLLRCRHVSENGQRISMFRAAFHTGYIPLGILRLTKEELDGACQDSRFSDDFFVDLIFESVELESSSEEPLGATDGTSSSGSPVYKDELVAFEEKMHRDDTFWDDMAARKKRHAAKKPSSYFAPPAAHSPPVAPVDGTTEPTYSLGLSTTTTTRGVSSPPSSPVSVTSSRRKTSWGDAQDAELMAEIDAFDESLDDLEAEGEDAGMEDSLFVATTTMTSLPEEGEKEETTDLLTFTSAPLEASEEKDTVLATETLTSGRSSEATTELSTFENATSAPISSSELELDDLDFLDDLTDGSVAIVTPTEGTATSSATALEGSDDLDDLEQYLEGLSTE